MIFINSYRKSVDFEGQISSDQNWQVGQIKISLGRNGSENHGASATAGAASRRWRWSWHLAAPPPSELPHSPTSPRRCPSSERASRWIICAVRSMLLCIRHTCARTGSASGTDIAPKCDPLRTSRLPEDLEKAQRAGIIILYDTMYRVYSIWYFRHYVEKGREGKVKN